MILGNECHLKLLIAWTPGFPWDMPDSLYCNIKDLKNKKKKTKRKATATKGFRARTKVLWNFQKYKKWEAIDKGGQPIDKGGQQM